MMAQGKCIWDTNLRLVLINTGKIEGYELMITSRISLEDVVSRGFEELATNKDDHVKILISPKLQATAN